MKLEDYEITRGENEHQNANIERNEKTIDYISSKKLSYNDILSLAKGLDVISEFFDVNACVVVNGTKIASVALGKGADDAILSSMDSNPVDFVNSNIILSCEIDSNSAKMLKNANIVAAPKFTPKAAEFFEEHSICYVTINTPLKDYKKYLSNNTKITPLGTLTETPNLSELNKDSFKVVTKNKPSVEQIEDAVFAWKIAKHGVSQAIVIAKDLKTSAILQGMLSSTVEIALDYSCERAKEAVLASDTPLTLHDVNAALQCRINLIIVPSATSEIIAAADKNNLALITTGVTNYLM